MFWIFKIGDDFVIYSGLSVKAYIDDPTSWSFTTVSGGAIAATKAYFADTLALAVLAAQYLKSTNLPRGAATLVWTAP